MTQEQKRIQIALAMGWTKSTVPTSWDGFAEPGQDPSLCACPASNLPDYFGDQTLMWNAVHEYFRNALPDQYLINLLLEIGAPVLGGFDSARRALSATAENHAEAFGKTLNLW